MGGSIYFVAVPFISYQPVTFVQPCLLACWLPAFFWLRCSDFCIPNEAEKKKNADKTMWKSKSSLVFGGPLSAVQSLSSFLIVCRYYGLYIIVQKLRCDQRCQSNCKGGVYFPIAGTTFNIDKLEDVLAVKMLDLFQQPSQVLMVQELRCDQVVWFSLPYTSQSKHSIQLIIHLATHLTQPPYRPSSNSHSTSSTFIVNNMMWCGAQVIHWLNPTEPYLTPTLTLFWLGLFFIDICCHVSFHFDNYPILT